MLAGKLGLTDTQNSRTSQSSVVLSSSQIYDTCLHEYGGRHAWMGFIDADEFVVLRDRSQGLPDLLQASQKPLKRWNQGCSGVVTLHTGETSRTRFTRSVSVSQFLMLRDRWHSVPTRPRARRQGKNLFRRFS